MLEIKVQCDCGQKYKFDVEPAGGRMPFQVYCPLCGLDGTEKANAVLKQRLPAEAAPAPVPVGAAAGAAPAPPIPPPGGSKLRIGASTSHASAPAATLPPPPAPMSRSVMPARAAAASKQPGEANLILGIVGAIVGGCLGMLGWYYLIKLTNHEIGYAAVGVGLLAGLGARVLGRGGSQVLGIVSGLCALAAILGGQYLFVAGEFGRGEDQAMEAIGEITYQAEKDAGKDAANAHTDDEIKAVYQKINMLPPNEKQLADFKEKKLPELIDVANGKITKEAFVKKLRQATDEKMGELGFSRFAAFKSTLDAFTILFLLLGVSSAYKLGAG